MKIYSDNQKGPIMLRAFTFAFILSAASVPLSASLFKAGSLWNKNKLNVCFASKTKELIKLSAGKTKNSFYNKGFTEIEKLKIKSWLLETYTLDNANISFEGFDNCEANKSADVIVYFLNYDLVENYFQAREGFASIGPEGKNNLFPDAQGYVVFDRLTPKKEVVVHEFGHLLGLAHEHNRPELKNEECYKKIYEKTSIIPYDTYVNSREKGEDQIVSIGEFDVLSIMNTCHLKKLRMQNAAESEITISAGDAATLREMYKDLLN